MKWVYIKDVHQKGKFPWRLTPWKRNVQKDNIGNLFATNQSQ
jgi:hypothetical protein